MQDYANITEDGTYNLFKVESPCPVQVDVTGDFGGGSVVFRKSRTPDGTYVDFISDSLSVTYTSDANPIFYTGGLYFQVVVSGTSGADISIGASGKYVVDHPDAGLVS